MVAGVVSDGSDDKALENRERVMETMHQARYAIEQRLAVEQSSNTTNNNTGSSTTTMSSSSSSTVDEGMRKEATAILTKLKSIMWDNVGVVRTPSKLAFAVSELSAIRTEADQLWNNSSGGGGSGCWEVVALRDAAYSGLAVAESALANRVSGGAHYVVLEESESESENNTNGTGGSKSDSDDEEPIHAVI
jgi:aspartate oxidase